MSCFRRGAAPAAFLWNWRTVVTTLFHPTTADAASGKVLFTAFGYDNAGVPKNPKNRFYTLDAKANPDGKDFVDLGLGGQLKKPSGEPLSIVLR